MGGKRDYDRKSGDNRTGIKAEDKRGGGGKGNWGTFEDDVPKEGEEANTTVDSEGKEEAAVEEEPKAPRELTAEELEAKLAREEDEEEEEEAVVYLQRSTRQKKLDINFTFADQG